MAITVAQFRADYPEFSSTTVYPDSQVNYWMNIAYILLNAGRWMRMLDMGAELFIAHNLALEARAQANASAGGIPGESTGPVSSKSVGPVSMGYDTTAGIEEGAGHWNLTIYGTRFIKLAKMFGAGPVQIGIGSAPSYSGMAWSGPLTTPGFTNFGN